MEIAMMCHENSLTDFVGDITDITHLINSMSPIVRELIKHSFKESTYTKKIKNLDWKTGEQVKVFGAST